jgi:hypothetical protein
MGSGERRQAFRRTRRTAVGLGCVGLLTFVATEPGGASADRSTAPRAAAVVPGQGLAIAQTTKVDPRAGGLSIGVTFGTSIAGHQNTVAQASSQAINLGVIGTTLAGEGCDGGDPTLAEEDQPQALQVDSRDEGAAEGKQETEQGAFDKRARATTAPYGEAITVTAPFGVAGVMEVGGGTARTFSGLVDGQREAHAFADVSGIKFPVLAGLGLGVVELSGLHWEAVNRSTGSTLVDGSFTIGSAKIAGQSIPTNDPTAALEQINAALAPIGIRIKPPVEREAGGVLFVDSMGISVVPNATRDALAGAVFDGIQPVRQSLFDALLEADCGNATFITVFDIVVGSITGAGAFNVNFGGVQASSGEVAENGFDLGFGDGLSPTLPGGDVVTQPGLPTDVGGSGLTPPGTEPAGDGGGDDVDTGTEVEQAANVIPEGKRGGALAGIGLGSLALLGAVAEGDRRKMRRAQREIPVLD